MADKKKVMLDDEWNARIEKALNTPVKKATPKKTVKKSTAKKKKK